MTAAARLPSSYLWLEKEGAPRILVEAMRLYGTKEKIGPDNNPEILKWADEVGAKSLGISYKQDSVPWCGLFMAVCAARAGLELPPIAIRASSWLQFGIESFVPMLGDVLVFTREGGGHVGLYVGEDATHFHVLGGNQSDKVGINRIAKSRLSGARRTAWKVAQPGNVRTIKLSPFGELSKNEA